MYFFSKKNKLLVALLSFILLILTPFFYSTDYDWFDRFFKKLEAQENANYRLLMIWVQADEHPEGDIHPIGGNPEIFQEWEKYVEKLLSRAKKYNSKFLLELIVDSPTSEYHQNLFANWKKNYHQFFKVTDVTEISGYERNQDLFNHCSKGIGAICSDIVRIWTTHDDRFYYNGYIDIDRFVGSVNQGFFYNSAKALGIYQQRKGIGVPVFYCNYNSDIIVDTDNQLAWDIIKTKLLNAYQDYKYDFEDIISRKKRLMLRSIDDYNTDLESRLRWWVLHPDRNFNYQWLILNVTGPGFWAKRLLEKKAYAYRHNPNQMLSQTNTWKTKENFSIDFPLSIESIEAYSSFDIAYKLMKITFMTYDYCYFKKRNGILTSELKKVILENLNEIDSNERVFEIYPHFLKLKEL